MDPTMSSRVEAEPEAATGTRRAINQLTLVQKWLSCPAEKKHSLNTKVHLAQTYICPKIALQRRVGIHLVFIEKGARMFQIVGAVRIM